MDIATLAAIAGGLFVLGLGGMVFAFAGSGDRSQKRLAAVAKAQPRARGGKGGASDVAKDRRKQVQDTLKDIERKAEAQRSKKLTLADRIEQAGLEFSVQTYWIGSAVLGLGVAGIALLSGQTPLIAALGAFAAAFGLPRWTLGFLSNARQKKFLNEFVSAIDILVRGVKAGLPVNECLKIAADECTDPVKSEFRALVDGQKVGVPIDQGLKRMYERMPLPEVNFFMIVLVIQSKTGGNLSEALTNLSNVLRDRKKMQGKIQAMSSEAKASAAIIGSLPPGVMAMVWLTTPDYINLLFTERLGNLMLMGSAAWMTMGVLVMKRMINFKF